MGISTEYIIGRPDFQHAYDAFRDGSFDIASLGISLEEQVLFLYRQELRRELHARLHGGSWISSDIEITKNILLLPGETQMVPIHLPSKRGPFTGLHEYSFAMIGSCVRSRFAQLGIEVPPNAGIHIASTIQEIGVNGSRKSIASIPVINYAARPIELAEGTKFFYFYYYSGDFLQGNDLKELMGSDILLSGEQGLDWDWWYETLPNGEQGEVKGIELFLDEKSFKTIPLHSEPMRMSDAPIRNHNREGVDQFLIEVDRSQRARFPQSQLYIGETRSHLQLSSKLHGILDQWHTRYEGKIYTGAAFDQTNSPVLQGGNTKSHIRVEIHCKEQFPSSVFVSFVNA